MTKEDVGLVCEMLDASAIPASFTIVLAVAYLISETELLGKSGHHADAAMAFENAQALIAKAKERQSQRPTAP